MCESDTQGPSLVCHPSLGVFTSVARLCVCLYACVSVDASLQSWSSIVIPQLNPQPPMGL